MMRVPPGFREFLRLLNSHRVEYLPIGGVSVSIISLGNSKINKKASARHKDLNDLEELP